MRFSSPHATDDLLQNIDLWAGRRAGARNFQYPSFAAALMRPPSQPWHQFSVRSRPPRPAGLAESGSPVKPPRPERFPVAEGMNDLLSRSFSRKREEEEPGGDVEMAYMDAEENLAPFFAEVTAAKNEMEQIRQLLANLRAANEESKTVHRAQAMKALRERMDADVEQVLRRAKSIKARLEELDRANAASRRVPGCQQGSSTDRTRTATTNGLRSSLKNLMGEFQSLRQAITAEYRETVERRYYTVTGAQADEETIERIIETGESEYLLQRAIREQGRGQVVEVIREIQERHDAVKEIERNLLELHQLFLDMSVLVQAQGEQLDDIEAQVMGASSFVRRGTGKLAEAKKLQKNTRKWTCIAIILLLVIILIVLLPVLKSTGAI